MAASSGEKLLPVILFAITFVVIASMLITLTSDLVLHQEINAVKPNPTSPEELLLENYQTYPYSPPVASTSGSSLNAPGAWQEFTFTSVGHTDVGCIVVRNLSTATYYWLHALLLSTRGWNNPHPPSDKFVLQSMSRIPNDYGGWEPTDFVMFWQSWQGGTLDLQRFTRYYVMSLDQIAAAAAAPSEVLFTNATSTNLTENTFHLRYWVTTFMTWQIASVADPNQALYDNRFNISVGAALNSSLGANPWSFLAEIVSFHFPAGIPPIIGYLMAVPIYICLGFVVVMVIIYAFGL